MDYSRYTSLAVTQDEGLFTVTLNRPEVRNVVDETTHDELATIFTELDRDDRCEVIILTGAGGFFCGGGDLNWLLDIHGDSLRTAHGNRSNQRIQSSMLDLEKPIIAKVRGAAVGLGASLALCCDFVYATPDSSFADPHVAVGLVAGDGGAYLWPQLIGYARARRYLLTGDAICGTDAAAIGLITEAVADEDLDEVVDAMARRLLNGARLAIKWTKVAINAGLKATAASVMDRGAALENLSFMTNDSRIAFEAFADKRRPKFTGS
jgi:enoyl-CoA hydratase